jgi:hypothetical protein
MNPFCNNVCAVVVGQGSKRLPTDVNAFVRVRAVAWLRTRMNESARSCSYLFVALNTSSSELNHLLRFVAFMMCWHNLLEMNYE